MPTIAHVEDVGAHDDQPAVLEDQALDGDDAGHHEGARPRSEQDGGQDAAEQVAGRAADDLEVEHLGSEDEGGHHAHERDRPLVERLVGLPHGDRQDDQERDAHMTRGHRHG